MFTRPFFVTLFPYSPFSLYGAFSYVDILSSLYNTNSTETLDPMIQEGFLKYYRNFIMESTAMDDWNDDNGPGFNAYAECEGNQLWSWKGKGYVTILKLLMVRWL